MSRKYTKAEVDYSEGADKEHCGICSHYRHYGDGGRCTEVEGEVEPDMWCKEFEKSLRSTIREAAARSV